jgi:hypothetical protein
MQIHEVENLPAAELKTRKAELIEALGGGELAQRYVQARTDAKMRDEKLAEQGGMIAALTNGNAALEEKLQSLSTRNGELVNDLEASKARSASLLEQLSAAQKQTTDQELRAVAAEKLAKARRAALADVMAFAGKLNEKVAPLLAE